MTYGISRPLVEFIHRYLRTMDHVEILLSLHRAGDVRSLARLAADTRLTDARTATVLQELESAGLVVASDALFKCAPMGNSECLLVELAEVYNARPVALVRAIYSRPSPMQSFADAFRFRKDEEEGKE